LNSSDKYQNYICDPLLIAEAAWGVDYLLESYPPHWLHQNKELIFEICKPAELDKEGDIKIKRFLENSCSECVSIPEIHQEFGNYKYLPNLEKDKTTHWHVNFSDPYLFGFAAGPAFAQDEIQVSEHPVLVSVGTAIERGDHGAKRLLRSTVEGSLASPMLLEGVPRFCTIDTEGIYGLLFRDAWESTIREKVTRLTPPTESKILALSAPQGTRGTKYSEDLIERIFRTAFSGFRAAVLNSGEVTVNTGFWGCGAFGNNRQLMTAIQLLAAGSAGVEKLVFWIPNSAFLAHFQVGLRIARELAGFETKNAVSDLAARGYTFAEGNGT
jgi:hypothetical protein